MRPNESDQLTIAVAIGAAADMYASGAVGVRDAACGPCDIADLIDHVAGGGVTSQPLNMSTQKSRERWDIPGRGLQTAFLCDQAGPGC